MKLETSNRRICKFYTDNPTIEFEAVNLIFIDLFEKLLNDMSSTMNSTIHSQILSNVNEHSQILNELKTSFSTLKDSISTLHTDITTSLLLKFMDIKKEYIEDVKNIVQNNTSDKVATLLEKNNNYLIDKTTLLMSDIVPKTQDFYYKQICETIQSFHKTLSEDTSQLIKYIDKTSSKDSMKEFITNFDSKSSLMIQTVQQPIYTFISASEERINSNISHLKENTSLNQITQSKVLDELAHFMQKYHSTTPSSQVPVQNTQPNELERILNKTYTTSQIMRITGGHYLMSRYSKPTIFIQNSNQETNVDSDEIKSFIKNTEENNCNGVFLSQYTGITSKPNYHIEIHAGNILVYVHTAEYCPEKIKVAVDIIDNLSTKIGELNKTGNHCSIPKDVLDEINREYHAFITQKEAISNTLKETQKKILIQIDDLKFPSLDKFLSTKYSSIQKQGFKCELCKVFTVSTLKGLAAHKRGCNRKIGATLDSAGKTEVKDVKEIKDLKENIFILASE